VAISPLIPLIRHACGVPPSTQGRLPVRAGLLTGAVLTRSDHHLGDLLVNAPEQ
jgi:hypothetical protein